jgi:type IV secretory pathway VirB10-like protein
MSSPFETSEGGTNWATYEEGGGSSSWAPTTPTQEGGLLLEQENEPPPLVNYFHLPVQARASVVHPTGDQVRAIPAMPNKRPASAGPAVLEDERVRKASRRRETRREDREAAEQNKAEHEKALARVAKLEAENHVYKTRIAELEAERHADHARIAERDVSFNAAMNSILETARAMHNYQNSRV